MKEGFNYEFEEARKGLEQKIAVKADDPSAKEDILVEKKFQAERADFLKKTITPELRKQYTDIVSKFKKDLIVGGALISPDKYEVEIQAWIDAVVILAQKNDPALTQEDLEGVRAETWNFFDVIARVSNTHMLEEQVARLYKEEKLERTIPEEREAALEDLAQQLSLEYGLSLGEGRILVSFVEQSLGLSKRKYSLVDMATMISRIFTEYKALEEKGLIAKIALGSMASRSLSSFAPYVVKDLVKDGDFRGEVMLESIGLGKLSELISLWTSKQEALFTHQLTIHIERRATELLFLQNFNIGKELSIEEIKGSIDRGKRGIYRIINLTLTRLIPTITGLAMSAALLAKINPVIAAVGLSGVPITLAFQKHYSKKRRVMNRKQDRIEDSIDEKVRTILDNLEEVKTAPRIDQAAEQLNKLLEERSKKKLDNTLRSRMMYFVEELPSEISRVVGVIVGIAFERQGLIPPGAIISNMQYSSQFENAIEQLTKQIQEDLAEALDDVKIMEQIIGVKDENPEGTEKATDIKSFDIKLSGVSLGGILRDANLEVKGGEFVVLSGVNGGGKTTLLRTILGLLKPEEGNVSIGGVNLDKLKLKGEDGLYSLMAYSKQDAAIIPDVSLRENIIQWTGVEANDGNLVRLLKAVHLDYLIPKLDQKNNTLSGGEISKIQIVKAILRKPKILLLDEPTKGLTPEVTRDVIELLRSAQKDDPQLTIICVSHDLQMQSAARLIDISEVHKGPRRV